MLVERHLYLESQGFPQFRTYGMQTRGAPGGGAPRRTFGHVRVAAPVPACYMEGVPVEDPISPEAQPLVRSASELQPGDRVVYPNQGVCRVVGTENKEIAGTTLTFVALTREEDNATILVPLAKVESIGLRKVAGAEEIEDVFDLLASSFEDPELDWKVRHRHHVDLLAAGEILGVAEVVKALQGIANMRPLPQRERERYDAARRLLEDEVAVALGVPVATAEDLIDFALIPPPGTVRAPRKPRRLAEIPPKPRATRPKRRAFAAEEGEDFEAFEEELEFEAPLDDELLGEEAPEEAEAVEEDEAAEEEPEAQAKAERKTKARSERAAKAKASETKAKAPAKSKTKAKAETTEAKAKTEKAKAPKGKVEPKTKAAKAETKAKAKAEPKATAKAASRTKATTTKSTKSTRKGKEA